MTLKREDILRRIWKGMEPFDDRDGFADRVDFQGWSSDHPYLNRAVDQTRAGIVIEVGVWKGGSVITMANHMKELGMNGTVIAVDTWLGSSEHWKGRWFESLRVDHGYPTLFRTFAANIMAKDLADYVVPVPLDSLNACEVLRACRIAADVLHLDGAHDYESVMSDLRVWWPLVRPGGVLVGDDYHPNADIWPDVRRAFHTFFNVDQLENHQGKCYVTKDS